MGRRVMIDENRCITDAKKCPLCGQPNNCEVDRGSDCWCFSETFSKELLLNAEALSTEVLNTEGLKADATTSAIKGSTIYEDKPTKPCICQCCVRGFDS
jgi:Cysteine-rich CWC